MTYPKSKSQLPAEAVAGNEDLITEILLRVPIKPLLRWKSVSKGWRSLISSTRFSRHYTLRNPNPVVSGLFLRRTPTEFQLFTLDDGNSSNTAPFRSLNFANDPAGIKILQSCNGLLLCSSFRKLRTKRYYYVYNPTTNKFSTLPPFPDGPKLAVFGVNLAFSPSHAPDYKVLSVRSTEESMYCYQIHIYESELNARRLSGSPFTAPFDMIFDNGVFWNGAIHWISSRAALLYFDLTNERLAEMPKLPFSETWGRRRRFRNLGESNGHLHLIEIYGPRCTQFKVFELSKDYSNWFIKYEINLDPILTAFPETVRVRSYLDRNDSNYYAFVPLFVVRDGADDARLLLHVPGKVVSYNVRDGRFKEVLDLTDGGEMKKGLVFSLQFGWLDAYPYIESLVPVC